MLMSEKSWPTTRTTLAPTYTSRTIHNGDRYLTRYTNDYMVINHSRKINVKSSLAAWVDARSSRICLALDNPKPYSKSPAMLKSTKSSKGLDLALNLVNHLRTDANEQDEA